MLCHFLGLLLGKKEKRHNSRSLVIGWIFLQNRFDLFVISWCEIPLRIKIVVRGITMLKNKIISVKTKQDHLHSLYITTFTASLPKTLEVWRKALFAARAGAFGTTAFAVAVLKTPRARSII